MAGQPEKRSTLGHLLNVSMPFSQTEPVWRLICNGVSELTEEFNPDTDEQQFICQDVKTTILKTYAPSFEVSMGYQKDDLIQYYFDVMSRRLPTGEKTSIEYIRFNKNETMFGSTNQFIGVKFQANVYFSSVGGAGDDYLTSVMTVSATGNPEIGYISVVDSGNDAVYTWHKANVEVPFVTSFEYTDNNTLVKRSMSDYYASNVLEIPSGVSTLTVRGKGEKNNYIELKSSGDLTGSDQLVSESGNWSMNITLTGNGEKNIAFIQKDSNGLNANQSVTTQSFNIKLPEESPIVPVPTVVQIDNHLASEIDNQKVITGTSCIVTGSGSYGLKVRLKCEDATPLTASDVTVSSNGIWTMTINIPSGSSSALKTFSFVQVKGEAPSETLSAETQSYEAKFTYQA